MSPVYSPDPQDRSHKTCPICGKRFKINAYQYDVRTYCSRACMAAGYRERMRGSGNPNYRAAGNSTCAVCGNAFQSYSKKRRYCSPECYREASKRHGKSHDSIYDRWVHMIGRCTNPNDDGWKNYGGRGIRVCERWRDFENFYADMGDPPPGKTLDRIDVNGNYCPENCRWATPSEQNSNQRRSLKYRKAERDDS